MMSTSNTRSALQKALEDHIEELVTLRARGIVSLELEKLRAENEALRHRAIKAEQTIAGIYSINKRYFEAYPDRLESPAEMKTAKR